MAIKDDLLAELGRREAKADYLKWCEYVLKPQGLAPAAHHQLLISELAAVARGEVPRLMVCMPPGSAKSTYSSVYLPPWIMAQAPGRAVIAASHTSDLAEGFSRRVMNVIREHGDTLGFSLATESVAGWETTNGGLYRAVGVGGPVTGRRADLLLIDDPIKSRAQADSPVERERVWGWYAADLRTRLRPGAGIILIMTRWHPDDLAGRLLQTQPDRWRVLNLPAQAEENDPLGRTPGEWLWGDDRYGYANELQQVLNDYETTGGMRDWAALYQQTPRAAEGNLFKVTAIPVLEIRPANIDRMVRAWDLAATKDFGTKRADWTAGVLLARTLTNSYAVCDVVRLQGGPEQVDAAILATAQKDGPDVEIALPVDPGQASKSQILHLTKMLAGYRVSATPERGDKSSRAAPAASQANVGNLGIVLGHWNARFIDELGGFPSSRHDDQVDALSRSFATLAPIGRGQGSLELARRDLEKWCSERDKSEPVRPSYQPGSVEFAAEQARLAAKQAEGA